MVVPAEGWDTPLLAVSEERATLLYNLLLERKLREIVHDGKRRGNPAGFSRHNDCLGAGIFSRIFQLCNSIPGPNGRPSNCSRRS